MSPYLTIFFNRSFYSLFNVINFNYFNRYTRFLQNIKPDLLLFNQ